MAGLLRGQKDADEQKESPAVPGLRVVSNKGERLEAPEPLAFGCVPTLTNLLAPSRSLNDLS